MKTHLDLFSGIGGFALAAKWAGFTTVGFCEREDYPRRVLARHWPGVQCHGDIRELDGEQYRGVSLITGGFPCQPFSVAGQQAGKADDRYLWPEMLRVIEQAQPTWVVAENVTGIINLALDQVLADLEAKDYACGTVVLPACAVDAPHRRDRVWIIAHANSQSEPDSTQREERVSENMANTTRPQLEKCEYVGRTPRAHVEPARPSEDVAYSGYSEPSRRNKIKEGQQSSPRGQTRSFSSPCSSHVAHSEVERIQGLWSGGIEESQAYARQEVPLCNYERIGPSYWQTEPDVGRVADGIPRRVDRLKGLGNAIVPQVAYQILNLLEDTPAI